VFVKVTSDEEIQRRLSGRGTETPETLATRLAKVRYEQSFEHEFDIVLINDELDETLAKAEDLVQAFIQS
jgi:guanylate kinase